MEEFDFLTFLHSFSELRKHFSNDTDFNEYLQNSSTAMETIRNILVKDGNPDAVMERCFRLLIEYYQADWCGMLNADLEIGAWTPVWWVDAKQGFLSPTRIKGFEIPENYSQWVDALKARKPIIIRDIEEIKEAHPDEYKNYLRLHVKRVIGIPTYKGSTGFVLVRNPKRYFFQLTPLAVIAYVAAVETNDLKLTLANMHHLTSDAIREETDVVISTFGGLRISSYYGTIQESDISIEGIGRIIALLATHRDHAMSPIRMADMLYPDQDIEAAITSIKNHIYHFRKDFSCLFHEESKFITTLENGYTLDPKLHIRTDYEIFDTFYQNARSFDNISRKIMLLKQAVKLYTGDFIPNLSHEIWLHGIRMHYLSTFLTITEKLCQLLFEQKDFTRTHEYAAQGLQHAPSSENMYYWMIRSLQERHMSEVAGRELKAARSALDDDSYEHLVRSLTLK